MLVESLVPLDDHKKKRKKRPKKKRTEQTEQASSQLAALSTKLLYYILSRLPAKTLLHLKCVCKAWKNVIQDPEFAKMHLRMSGKGNENLNLIMREEKLHLVDLNLLNKAVQINHPLTCPEGWTDVSGSCNGLVCLCNQDNAIALWNPLTGSRHKLPITNFVSPKSSDGYQSFIYGFGYDPVSDDYKVVQILQCYYYCGYDSDGFLDPESDTFAGSEVQIYSLKNKYWRRIQCFPYILCYPCSGVLANGALHWVARERRGLDSTSYILMAFDLGLEICRELPQPSYNDIHFHMSLALLGGSLCILCHYPKHGVDIWVMKDYVSSWKKLVSIIQPKPIKIFEYIKPLAYSKNGNELLLVIDYVKLFWFNLKKKTIRHVNISDLPMASSFGTEVFSGSLLDPDNIYAKNQRNSLAIFPEKVLRHIFSWLPVKTLLQVQRVCKTWYNLINASEFIKTHLVVSSKCKSGLSLVLKGEKFFTVDLQLLDKVTEIKHPLLCNEKLADIVGISNGLVCLYEDNDFALWNPWTGKFGTVPFPNFQLIHAFSSFHWFIHGFGYDPINDDFKVVCILQQHSRLGGGSVHTEVQVYSLKTKSWGWIQQFPYFVCYPCSGVLASGALHWVARPNPDLYSNSNLLIAFDLNVEKCRVVTQPDYVDTDFHMSLGILGDGLCLLCHYPKETLDVWVMTDYDSESWTKLVSICQPNVVRRFEYMKPLAYSVDGTEVLLEQDNKKLLWYNLARKTVKYVELHGLPKSFETVICLRSLVPVGTGSRSYEMIHESKSLMLISDASMDQVEPPPKGFQDKKDKKKSDDLDGFLTKGFQLKL